MQKRKNLIKRIFTFILAMLMIFSLIFSGFTVVGAETTDDYTTTGGISGDPEYVDATIKDDETTTEEATSSDATSEESTTQDTTQSTEQEVVEYSVSIQHLISSGTVKNSTITIQGVTNPNFMVKYSTDANGTININLPEGEYILKSDTLSGNCYYNKDVNIKVIASNTKQNFKYYTNTKGTLILNASSKSLKSIEKTEEDELIKYKLNYGEVTNANVTYTIFAKEAIKLLDGTVLFEKNATVGTITSDTNGLGKVNDLYAGDYYLAQTITAEGHVVDKNRYEFSINPQNISNNDLTTSVNITEKNIHAKISFIQSIEGLDKANDTDKIKKLASTIKYGLYTESNIYAKDGSYVPANGLIEITTIKDDLTGLFEIDLPVGKYYIQQIESGLGLEKNTTKYSFEVNADGLVEENIKYIQPNDNKAITNKYFQGTISGVLLNKDKNEFLSNSKIGIFKNDAKTFDLANALKVTTTNTKGEFEFSDLEPGIYYIVDLTAPTGYTPTEDVRRVELTAEEPTATIEINNTSFKETEKPTTEEKTEEATTEEVVIKKQEVEKEKSNIGMIILIVVLIVLLIAIIVILVLIKTKKLPIKFTKKKNNKK